MIYVYVLQFGRTPLHYAASHDCIEAVNSLCAKGATVDIIDNVSYSNNIV